MEEEKKNPWDTLPRADHLLWSDASLYKVDFQALLNALRWPDDFSVSMICYGPVLRRDGCVVFAAELNTDEGPWDRIEIERILNLVKGTDSIRGELSWGDGVYTLQKDVATGAEEIAQDSTPSRPEDSNPPWALLVEFLVREVRRAATFSLSPPAWLASDILFPETDAPRMELCFLVADPDRPVPPLPAPTAQPPLSVLRAQWRHHDRTGREALLFQMLADPQVFKFDVRQLERLLQTTHRPQPDWCLTDVEERLNPAQRVTQMVQEGVSLEFMWARREQADTRMFVRVSMAREIDLEQKRNGVSFFLRCVVPDMDVPDFRAYWHVTDAELHRWLETVELRLKTRVFFYRRILYFVVSEARRWHFMSHNPPAWRHLTFDNDIAPLALTQRQIRNAILYPAETRGQHRIK